MTTYPLNKASIRNFDIIIDAIWTDTLNEHLGDVIALLDRYDKKRELKDPELKSAVFAIVKEIVDRDIAKLIFEYSLTAPIPYPIPTTSNQVLEHLDKYWGKPDDPDFDIGMSFLLFFGKRAKTTE